MTLYINSPQWFYGIDSVMELMIVVITVLISVYAFRIYKITAQKKYMYFSGAFLLTGVSYVFKILSEIVIYSRYVEQKIIGPLIISRTVIEPVTWIHTYSHTAFRMLITLAFFMLLVVTLKIKEKPSLILLTYFMIVTIIIGQAIPLIFHVTHVLMLAFLISHYYKNHTKQKTKQTSLITSAFIGLLLSHIVFIFIRFNENIYAIAEGIQIISFGLLLYAFILVKKK